VIFTLVFEEMGVNLIAFSILVLAVISFGDSLTCDDDSDCQTERYNRYCSFGSCICKGYYFNNNKCIPIFDYPNFWIWIAIFLSFKIIFIIIWCTRKRRGYSTVVRINPQPYTILTNEGHGSDTHRTSHEINSSPIDQFLSSHSQNANYPPPPYSKKY
jgi:hypothetical protein